MAIVTQANYNVAPAQYLLGQIADLTDASTVSRSVETSAGIGFGIAVIQGTADKQVKLGAAGSFIGLTVIDRRLMPDDADTYKQYEVATVLIRGTAVVSPFEAVTAGAAVYRNAAGRLGVTASGNTLVDRAIWETTTAQDGLGVVRLR